MGKRKVGVMASVFGLMALTVIPQIGCGGEEKDYYYEFGVSNRSTKELDFVTIDTGGVKNKLGYFSPEKKSALPQATADGCQFRYSPESVIRWEEGDKPHTAKIDVMQYAPKKAEIKSFCFVYLGDDKWQVTAHSGHAMDSPEVLPQSGCGGEEKDCYYEFGVTNRGPKEIRFVTIDTGGVKNELGYFSPEKRRESLPQKTADDCKFRYSPESAITWGENDKSHSAKIDIMKYEPKKAEIQSFCFVYLGDDKWQVAAHSGHAMDSPEVKP